VTISRGHVVWHDGTLRAVRGAGRHIPRPPFSPVVFEALNRKRELAVPKAVER
jgi:dihydropyrimidinase